MVSEGYKITQNYSNEFSNDAHERKLYSESRMSKQSFLWVYSAYSVSISNTL
jgi:hypothetical protein